MAEGSTELPAVQELLRRMDLAGSLVSADALNTQAETAHLIVQDRGGHYLFTVKGIETGLHLRLDVSEGEDCSRVRHRTSALNLAMIRLAIVSLAVRWIKNCPDPRKATTGFRDAMAAQQSRKAFSLVTSLHAT